VNIHLRLKTDAFKHLWGKYVTGFDVEQHCVQCLQGHFCRHFFRKRFVAGTVIEGELDEHEAPFFYLCGVTESWPLNVHLAVRPKRGFMASHEDHNIIVLIDGGEPVPITPVRAGRPMDFENCRNWQFGYRYFYEPGQAGAQGALL
jgi:hypothetical protein